MGLHSSCTGSCWACRSGLSERSRSEITRLPSSPLSLLLEQSKQSQSPAHVLAYSSQDAFVCCYIVQKHTTHLRSHSRNERF